MSAASPRSVVVTGGSRGLGRAVCLAFAPVDRVYFSYQSGADAAQETCHQIAVLGGQAVALQADVTSEESTQAFLQRVLADTGRIDVLVNNAGITRDNLLVRMKNSDWDQVLDTNLKGAFMTTRLAARSMIKQRYGRVINISSVVSASGNPGQANYAAAKAGLNGLTRALARELASRNITVNAIAPGFIETDMTAGLSAKAREEMVRQIPLGRIGAPEDIAGMVQFLASPRADYITGQVIHVNGGMFM